MTTILLVEDKNNSSEMRGHNVTGQVCRFDLGTPTEIEAEQFESVDDLQVSPQPKSILSHMKNTLFLIIFLFLFSFAGVAQMEIVEIEPQLAKSIAGVVSDPLGAALPGVTVEERSDDWKKVLRSTKTDDHGQFHFSARWKKTIYHLEFSLPGFHRVRLKLQLDKKAAPAIAVEMRVAT